MANESNQTIMDVILEKTTNIEQINNRNSINKTLSEIVKTTYRREGLIRESTITITIESDAEFEKIRDAMEKEWVNDQNESAIVFWKDRDNLYAQFINKSAKEQFLDFTKLLSSSTPDPKGDTIGTIWSKIAKPNSGLHFKRRPAKIIVLNIKANQKLDSIKATLDKLAISILEIKEGKMNEHNRSRNIMFRTDANGIERLFKDMDGAIPYSNPGTGTRTRLILKINVKPWQCRDCYKVGQHTCEGKLCVQCGNKGHESKMCKSKTKFCPNCKQKGHKAKDTQCNYYLNEVAKEIRKIDIPMEMLEDSENRHRLITYLQYK